HRLAHAAPQRRTGRGQRTSANCLGGRGLKNQSKMLRDKSLIPLSRQHQHALALCVRIDRASPIADSDLAAWQAEVTQLCQAEIEIHFTAEEQALFPAARRFEEL